MRSTRPHGLFRLSLPLAALSMALPLFLSACGGSGVLGGQVVVPTVVFVDDAPVIGALVQDRAGAAGAQEAVASSPGQYRFEENPTLPLKISSRNIVGADGRVRVTQVGAVWYSYDDVNNNGQYDRGEALQLLTFQDLDGNGLYTQSVDIVFNGAFQVAYFREGATVVQANVVASLLPQNWDGVSSVAGLSPKALNAAVSLGPSQSNNAELQRATAVLTAISEGLLSTLRTTGTSATVAAAQSTIGTVLSSLAAAGAQVDLTKTDAASVARVAQTVSAALPPSLQTQATNLVTNVTTVLANANPTSGQESIVKVTQERLPDLVASPSASTQQQLASDVTLAVNSITVAKEQATPNVDPDAVRIAGLRLVPLGMPDPVTEQASGTTIPSTWVDLSSTRGFALARQSDGTLSFTASGEPFQTVLGATNRTIPFVSARNSWEYTGNAGQSLKIKLNFSVPLFNALGGTDAGALSGVSMLQLCSGAGACAYYIMASAQQLCSPNWVALAQAWTDIGTGASRSFYSAVNAINATSVSCGS